jgi:hypothetical protein
MLRKVILTFLLMALFLPLFFVFAGLEINEIMYDLKSGSDDGREWIEIYNNSDEIVDFSAYKFIEADTNHKLSFVQGSAKIEPHGFVLIVSDFAKFKTDWPSVSSSIFDSTFSLNNSGESLAIKNNEQVVDSYFYKSSTGGAGNGKSLQKITGVWTSSTLTPGSENKISYAPAPTQSKEETKKPESPVKVEENSTLEDLPQLPTILNTIEPTENSKNLLTPIVVFLGLLVLSSYLVIFLRKNKKIPQNKDDFELLE